MTEDLDILIARVVDGDLAPADLRRALAALDAAPGGWKDCTLAFLEARGLDDALRRPEPATPPPPALPRRRRPSRPVLAAAAVALLAFGAGRWTVERPAPTPHAEPTPTMVAAREETPAPAAEVAPPAAGALALAVPGWVLNQPLPVPSDAQAALESRGYRLEQRRRIVAARLPDGRRVVRPVDRVRVSYVGAASL